jgi:gamma-glutamyltranspeptidase/glutathione hydrolase
MVAAAGSLSLLFAEISGAQVPLFPFGPPPIAVSRRGVAAAATPEAAAAGAEILAAGGNAVDAAVATAFALAVTYPQAGNLAGGGFAVVRSADGTLRTLDFRETAPAGTWRNSFLDVAGAAIPGASQYGGLAVGTPGTVRGLETLHRTLGRLPWKRLLAPAIRLAKSGFLVHEGLTAELDHYRSSLLKDPEARRIFFPGGAALAPGSRLVQPELAGTLEAIARSGADGFHRGEVAAKIVAFVRRTGGVLSVEDIAGYAPVWRAPFVWDEREWRIVTMPLPSAGGFLLAEILGQLDAAPGDIRPRTSPLSIHLIAEAERRAFADRNVFLGDADCVDVPLARLLAPARLAALGASIDPRRATRSPEIVPGWAPVEKDQTTHFSTASSEGDAVSLTYTLNDTFGNRAVVPGVGVLLNNEMDDFTAVPGVANIYGLAQGEANTVHAGGRPLSSMTPVIVLQDGRPRFVFGSPGGSTIPTTVLQVFLNAVLRGMPLADAVAAPRFHHQHLPDQIEFERGAWPEDIKEALRRLGHTAVDRGTDKTSGKLGRVHAIAFEKDGTLTAVADPRGYGAAAAAEGFAGPSPASASEGRPATPPSFSLVERRPENSTVPESD